MASDNTENFQKFGRLVFEIRQQTEKQICRHAHHNTAHPYRGKIYTHTLINTYITYG